MQIEVTVQDQELEQKLQQLTKKLKNLKPLMSTMGSLMLEATEENFAEESFFGVPWAPWSSSTAQQRAGGKKLQDTGSLAGSIHVQADRYSVALGTNLVYAAIHQAGGRAGRGKASVIPARPFLPVADGKLHESMRRRIMDEAELWLEE